MVADHAMLNTERVDAAAAQTGPPETDRWKLVRFDQDSSSNAVRLPHPDNQAPQGEGSCTDADFQAVVAP